MSHTNSTTNYELTQFLASDKPAWLVDYNGDMTKIDTAIHAAKELADTLDLSVTTLQADVGTLDSNMTQAQADISTLQAGYSTLSGTVTQNTSDISTLGTSLTTVSNTVNTHTTEIATNATNIDAATNKTTQHITGSDTNLYYRKINEVVSISGYIVIPANSSGTIDITDTIATDFIPSLSYTVLSHNNAGNLIYISITGSTGAIKVNIPSASVTTTTYNAQLNLCYII